MVINFSSPRYMTYIRQISMRKPLKNKKGGSVSSALRYITYVVKSPYKIRMEKDRKSKAKCLAILRNKKRLSRA